jgi:repressor of nif and glnA expression
MLEFAVRHHGGRAVTEAAEGEKKKMRNVVALRAVCLVKYDGLVANRGMPPRQANLERAKA